MGSEVSEEAEEATTAPACRMALTPDLRTETLGLVAPEVDNHSKAFLLATTIALTDSRPTMPTALADLETVPPTRREGGLADQVDSLVQAAATTEGPEACAGGPEPLFLLEEPVETAVA